MEKETLPVNCGDKSPSQLTSDRKNSMVVKVIGAWGATLGQQCLP